MPPPALLSDEDLLAALRAAGPSAFEEVVRRYGARVLNTCLGLVPQRADACAAMFSLSTPPACVSR